jgi:hypothetical protein
MDFSDLISAKQLPLCVEKVVFFRAFTIGEALSFTDKQMLISNLDMYMLRTGTNLPWSSVVTPQVNPRWMK